MTNKIKFSLKQLYACKKKKKEIFNYNKNKAEF